MKTAFLVLCAIIKCCLQNSALILGLMPLQFGGLNAPPNTIPVFGDAHEIWSFSAS